MPQYLLLDSLKFEIYIYMFYDLHEKGFNLGATLALWLKHFSSYAQMKNGSCFCCRHFGSKVEYKH